MGVQWPVGTMFASSSLRSGNGPSEVTSTARRRPDRPVRALRLDTLEPGGGGAHRGGRAARIRKAAVISAKPNATGLGHRGWNSVTVKEKFGFLPAAAVNSAAAPAASGRLL